MSNFLNLNFFFYIIMLKIYISFFYIFLFFLFSLFLAALFFSKLKKFIFLNKLLSFLPFVLKETFGFYLVIFNTIFFINSSSFSFPFFFSENLEDLLAIRFYSKKYYLKKKNIFYYTLLIFQLVA